MSVENNSPKDPAFERFSFMPKEGAMIAALLGLLRIVVEVEGKPTTSPAAIFAGYPHTSHLDTMAIAWALRQEGRTHLTPVTKGDYWNRRIYKKLLRAFFGKDFEMTRSAESNNSTPRGSFFEIFFERIQSGEQYSVIIYPEGGRNVSPQKVHRGAFVVSSKAQVDLGITVPVQPIELQDMPQVLTSGDLQPKEILRILKDAMKNIFTGKKYVVKVIFHESIMPDSMLEKMEIETDRELSGAMMQQYLNVLQLSSHDRV